jgi:hypothetical protein
LPEEAQALLNQGERLALADDKPKAILMGRHLLGLGVEPGPPMGAMLKQAFEAQLDGAFSNVEEGIEWLRRQERSISETSISSTCGAILSSRNALTRRNWRNGWTYSSRGRLS